ncbi:hypothetical protein J8J40_23275, partial [Mycobacterium tuberculosis]|nr:hypothetical protein [Mycobacterium tuberculosis]
VLYYLVVRTLGPTLSGIVEGRRARAAEAKIALAESQAVAEVRALAVDTAVAAAAKILAGRTAGAFGAELIANSIEEARVKLN